MTISSTDTLVIESTSSKVRTFLYELAEGTFPPLSWQGGGNGNLPISGRYLASWRIG